MQKIHVEGDPKLKNNPGKQYSMFIGRWQPWHKGHRWLIDQRLEEGKNVLILIRDINPDEKNQVSELDQNFAKSFLVKINSKAVGLGASAASIAKKIHF